MKNYLKLSILLLLLSSKYSSAQQEPFQLAIVPFSIPDLGGIQSYAWGQHNGKWLIIGGRLDGLHRRQPFAAFDAAGNNIQLIVVDPVAQQKWSAPLTSLPQSLQEQLSSSNMQFYQQGDYLYLTGGYGYSALSANHITYPNLTAVKVAEVIDAIVSGNLFANYFRQINDNKFAVTGGYLNKIYDTFYLTGGQNFIGRYNPMGPDFGPGFFQEYTNAIRKFNVVDDGVSIIINHFEEIIDTNNLHRRDYNVTPQIFPGLQHGLTAFSGVFQPLVDLPYLNCVNIDSTGYSVNNNFEQYYNHYHCAHIPLYSSQNNEMHTVFFGGIAQFYDSLQFFIQDDNVPFVKTIARVTRNGAGEMTEEKLPIEMPSFLGAGSEFIPIESIPHFSNDVLDLDVISSDSTLLGYIFGGISSTESNIFNTNTGSQSSANNTIFKVYLINNKPTGNVDLKSVDNGSFNLNVYPNANAGIFNVEFNLIKNSDVKITFTNNEGIAVKTDTLDKLQIGKNSVSYDLSNILKNQMIYITLECAGIKETKRIISK
jgi:hypothetical protein